MNRAIKLIKSVPWLSTENTVLKIAEIAARENQIPKDLKNLVLEPLGGVVSDKSPILEFFDDVAVIKIIGPIFRYASLFENISGATSVQSLNKAFRIAENTPGIKAIVEYIDSPGGEVAGISEYAAMTRESSIPVIAVVGGMSASGAYWIASAADKIYGADTSMFGSIGAVMSISVDNEDNDIEFVSSVSPYKRVDAETDEGKTKYQSIVDKLGSVFVNTVAEYRGKSSDIVVSGFGQGGLIVGEDAVAVGMIDGLKTLSEVINEYNEKGMIMENGQVVKADYDAGVADERKRVTAIIEHVMVGCEELAFDYILQGATAEDALKGMISYKKNMASTVREEMEESAKVDMRKDEDENADDSVLMNEFGGDEKSYAAYKNAVSKGLVKVRGK